MTRGEWYQRLAEVAADGAPPLTDETVARLREVVLAVRACKTRTSGSAADPQTVTAAPRRDAA